MLAGTEDVSKNVQIFKAMEKGNLVADVSDNFSKPRREVVLDFESSLRRVLVKSSE